MPILEPAIRPPAEADSFLLQVTCGCSSNRCSFCGAYQGKPYGIKSVAEVKADIQEWSVDYPDERRVFLMDGDALALSNEKLLPILEELNRTFPKLSRIASYANGYNISSRTDQQLEEVYQQKMRLVYLGLESGSQAILDHCQKKSTVVEMVEAVQRVQKHGIKASVMVLLGLGGKKSSADHVRETIMALNRMQPRYLSFLSLMLIPGTRLWDEARRGEFTELNPEELLQESHDIIEGLELQKTVFRSDHASNFLSLEGRFPADKAKLLSKHQAAVNGQLCLKPEFLRGW